jgi:hypothetical protein
MHECEDETQIIKHLQDNKRKLINLNRNSVISIELQTRLMSYPAFRAEAYFLNI